MWDYLINLLTTNPENPPTQANIALVVSASNACRWLKHTTNAHSKLMKKLITAGCNMMAGMLWWLSFLLYATAIPVNKAGTPPSIAPNNKNKGNKAKVSGKVSISLSLMILMISVTPKTSSVPTSTPNMV